MITYVPTYYHNFKCIADKCLHTCCEGWEIDVDDESMVRYSTNASVNKFIKDGQFILDKNERCPFLRSDGLCEMILQYGEDYLCNICKDHPRFRNFFGDHIEMGIGLCCEEAVRVILEFDGKFALQNIDDSTDLYPVPECISVFQNSDSDIITRINDLYVSNLFSKERAKIYMELERLDDSWTTMLQKLIETDVSKDRREEFIRSHESAFQQLIIYFMFRHGDYSGFAVESVNLIADLCVLGYDLYEVVRMYSSEIEYSDLNVDTLIWDEFFD